MLVQDNQQDCQQNCQIYSLPTMAEGKADDIHLALRWKLRLLLTMRLSSSTKRSIKKLLIGARSLFSPSRGMSQPISAAPRSTRLEAGDLVRVRSKEEILATLNPWRELKGCKFISEMAQYCGTMQRVLKPVERFLDERDYMVKKVRGLVLLDGLLCQGTAAHGRCDRACFFFWREEWLEKIDVVADHADPT